MMQFQVSVETTWRRKVPKYEMGGKKYSSLLPANSKVVSRKIVHTSKKKKGHTQEVSAS